MAGGIPVDGVSELVLEVVDLEAAEMFYAGVFGFPVVDRWEAGGRIWVMAGTHTRIGLWRPQLGIANGRGGLHVHFALHISDGDFDGAVARLRDHGYDPEVVLFYYDERGRSFYVTDPDRNVVTSDLGREGPPPGLGDARLSTLRTDHAAE